MKCVRLGVNVDHVATLRQARGTRYPDPIMAASVAEMAGADQITIHLREDRRHIQDRDLILLKDTVQTRLNLEMGVTEEMLAIALRVMPDEVTLVPERRQELTTEGGLNVQANMRAIAEATRSLTEAGIAVSLFIDPDIATVEAVLAVEASIVELHTGRWCNADNEQLRQKEFDRLRLASARAKEVGLMVAVGHGLHYHNVHEIIKIEEIEELNIGHSIVARSVFVGLDQAIRDMLALMKR